MYNHIILMLCTSFDIVLTKDNENKYTTNSSKVHFEEIQWILGYIKSTNDYDFIIIYYTVPNFC